MITFPLDRACLAIALLRSVRFLKINISHGSVVTTFRCDGNFNDDCLPSLSVKEFCISVKI